MEKEKFRKVGVIERHNSILKLAVEDISEFLSKNAPKKDKIKRGEPPKSIVERYPPGEEEKAIEDIENEELRKEIAKQMNDLNIVLKNIKNAQEKLSDLSTQRELQQEEFLKKNLGEKLYKKYLELKEKADTEIEKVTDQLKMHQEYFETLIQTLYNLLSEAEAKAIKWKDLLLKIEAVVERTGKLKKSSAKAVLEKLKKAGELQLVSYKTIDDLLEDMEGTIHRVYYDLQEVYNRNVKRRIERVLSKGEKQKTSSMYKIALSFKVVVDKIKSFFSNLISKFKEVISNFSKGLSYVEDAYSLIAQETTASRRRFSFFRRRRK